MSAQAQDAYLHPERERPRQSRHLEAVATASLGGLAAGNLVSSSQPETNRLHLSPYESGLMIGLSEGRTLKNMAKRLIKRKGLSYIAKLNTVVAIQKSLFIKLDAKNEAHCVNLGIRSGLIPITERPDKATTEQLNPIDSEILGFMAEGGTHVEFAEAKGIPTPAVDAYCNNLLTTIDASNEAHGVTRAYELGVLALPSLPTDPVI
jgi:hypothetical protein